MDRMFQRKALPTTNAMTNGPGMECSVTWFPGQRAAEIVPSLSFNSAQDIRRRSDVGSIDTPVALEVENDRMRMSRGRNANMRLSTRCHGMASDNQFHGPGPGTSGMERGQGTVEMKTTTATDASSVPPWTAKVQR